VKKPVPFWQSELFSISSSVPGFVNCLPTKHPPNGLCCLGFLVEDASSPLGSFKPLLLDDKHQRNRIWLKRLRFARGHQQGFSRGEEPADSGRCDGRAVLSAGLGQEPERTAVRLPFQRRGTQQSLIVVT